MSMSKDEVKREHFSFGTEEISYATTKGINFVGVKVPDLAQNKKVDKSALNKSNLPFADPSIQENVNLGKQVYESVSHETYKTPASCNLYKISKEKIRDFRGIFY